MHLTSQNHYNINNNDFFKFIILNINILANKN